MQLKQNRLLLIINPIAGTSKKKDLDTFCRERLSKAGWLVDVEFTRARNDATRIARKAIGEGYDAVVAAGGDGTVNETARALCDTGMPLGIIPCGSGNGLARHLNIPIDVSEALDVIACNHTQAIDYGRLNDRYFFCTCGVGFDAEVSHKFASKGTRGLSTYIRSTIEEYLSYEPAEYTIELEGQIVTEKAFLIAVCNASQYGNNAYIAPKASIDDGLLDITIVHQGNVLQSALMAFDLLNGNLTKNALVSSYRAKAMRISRNSGTSVHIDGEPITIDSTLDICCHPGGLRVFTPHHTPRFIPFISPAGALLREFRLLCKHTLGIR